MILFHVAVVQCPNYIPWFLWISFDFWAAIRIGIPARCRRSSLGGNRSDDNIVERLSIFFLCQSVVVVDSGRAPFSPASLSCFQFRDAQQRLPVASKKKSNR